ncbi:peptidylprolyl isomerase [Thalassotalea crassostreae]|uniref:peptidylprolyl isomerase n=1 Tax=Thalassotalea crassostreae TaxID=1763536 RepID=UPI000838C443|nr:peptidylprolyl isomerase [Thalassotalea crassostreae]
MKPFILKITYVYVICVLALLIGVAFDNDPASSALQQHIATLKIDKSEPNWKRNLSLPPKLSFAENKSYYWEMVTNKGPIEIELLPQYAPMHVSSTMFLTEIGFYNDLKFHRVMPGFMMQGGDPMGTGQSGPGYQYDGEFHKAARHNQPGILSMANRGPGTDGSQFFITFKETRWLDNKHTVFGKVTNGFETLSAIEAQGSQSGRTKEELKILTASIVVKNKESKK